MPRVITPFLAGTSGSAVEAGVSQFNARSGAVSPTFGDYTTDLIANLSPVTGETLTDALVAAAASPVIDVRDTVATNPSSPYTPSLDGKIIPIVIDDGRALTINQPSSTPSADIDECVQMVTCEALPCSVVPGTWGARDGIPGTIYLQPGDTVFVRFYFARGVWTLKGNPIADDDQIVDLPTGFGLVGPARLSDALAVLHQRLAALEGGDSPIAGVTTVNDLAGDVRLSPGAGLTITPSGQTLTVALASGSGGGVQTVTAGGHSETPTTLSFAAGAGMQVALVDGVIRYTLAGDTGQTVTTRNALVHASAPTAYGETTAVVDVTPTITLGTFDAVGDIQVVKAFGRVEFPTTASGNKSPIFTVTINGTATTLTGPALGASSAGRAYILNGYLVRTDATTLASLWTLRLSNAAGALADGGGFPDSMVSPSGQYLIGASSATVADWSAATFKLGASWSADAETKKLVVETITIGRLGRDSDTTQGNKLFLSANTLATDLTQTTATDLLTAVSIPANTLEKDGAACELLLGGYVTSGSATPTLQLQAKVNGAATTNGAPGAFSVGAITGQKKILARVLIYRASPTAARVKVTYALGGQGTAGSLSTLGSAGHDTSQLITGLDFTIDNTLGLSGAWSVSTGTPHLFMQWYHCRRISDQLGRFVGATGATTAWATVGTWAIDANTFAADGVAVLLRSLSSLSVSGSATMYPSYKLTVGGTVISMQQSVTGGSSRNLDFEAIISRISATQLRVVAVDQMYAVANTQAFPVMAFSPASAIDVKLEVRTTNAAHTITPEYASLASLYGGGETVIT